jgi:hypothetical protein
VIAVHHQRSYLEKFYDLAACSRASVLTDEQVAGVLIPSLTGVALDKRDRVSDQPDEDLGVLAAKQFLVIEATLDAIANLAGQAPAGLFGGLL